MNLNILCMEDTATACSMQLIEDCLKSDEMLWCIKDTRFMQYFFLLQHAYLKGNG